MATKVESPTLADLGLARRRIDGGYSYLLEHVDTARQYDAGRRRLSEATDEYLTLVSAFRRAHEPSALAVMAGELYARLERGWLMDPTPEVLDHFDTLLRQYEAVSDARRGIQLVGDEIRSRVRMLEAVRATKKQGVNGGVA